MIRIEEHPAGCLVRPTAYLGDRFGAFREAMRAGGARWSRETKQNTAAVDAIPHIYEALRARGFDVHVSDALLALARDRARVDEAQVEHANGMLDTIRAELAARDLVLRPYQEDGIAWLAMNRAAILDDQMGLGKTNQALLAARLIDPMMPIVVVAPALAKGSWANVQVPLWRPDLTARVLSGRGSWRWPEPGEIVVTNFDILPEDPGEAPRVTALVVDEAHAIKNPKALRTKRIRAVSGRVRSAGGPTWLLTGTPLLNRQPELWELLDAIEVARVAFSSKSEFARMAGAHLVQIKVGRNKVRTAYDWSGTPEPAIADRLRRVMLGRRRADVAPDLPTKSYEDVPVELDRSNAKFQAITERLEDIGVDEEWWWDHADDIVRHKKSDAIPFDMVAEMRAAIADAKIPALLKTVEEYEEQDEPVLVFSAHVAPARACGERDGWGCITGDTHPDERTRLVEAFQAGALRGLAGTIKAMGVAVTLTRAAHVVFCDLEWTPALNEQAEDRACRIGQTRGVMVRRLVADHKMDQAVTAVLGKKDRIIAASITRAAVDRPSAPGFLGLAAHRNAEPEPAAPGTSTEACGVARGARRRPPETPVEEWARRALLRLAGSDPDHARVKNDIGFNASDNEIGHSFASQVERGLTDKQWALAIKICRKYHRQIGEPPQEAAA